MFYFVGSIILLLLTLQLDTLLDGTFIAIEK